MILIGAYNIIVYDGESRLFHYRCSIAVLDGHAACFESMNLQKISDQCVQTARNGGMIARGDFARKCQYVFRRRFKLASLGTSEI